MLALLGYVFGIGFILFLFLVILSSIEWYHGGDR